MPTDRIVAALLGCLMIVGILSPRCPAGDEFSDFRALWVTRFDYRNGNANTVRGIVDNAASLGITDLMFQVRGQADAYYNSQYEPRSQSLSGSWDPLQTAIDQAHLKGIKLHAWINTMPLWTGTSLPSTSTAISHPFYHHDPSYRIHDLSGNPEPLNSSYVTANPILPEWNAHVTNVADDIVTNYAVDGLHLDYTRWLGSTSWSELPHDDQSHQLFTTATGLSATSNHAGAYRDFIRDQLTQLVRDVEGAVHAANADAELSAAVWRDPDVGHDQVLQDYRTWMEEDLIDTIVPMIYLSESNNHLFAPNLSNVMSVSTNARVAPGIGVYLHDDPDFTVSQLEKLVEYETGGVVLYAYSSFFASGSLGTDRFQTVKTYLDSVETTDPGSGSVVVVTDFESDEGYFGTSATYSGSNQGIPSATADRVTTQAQAGIGAQRIVVDGSATGWFLRHVAGIAAAGQVASPDANLPLDATGAVGFYLMTEDSGLEVSLALDDPSTADRAFRQAVIADGQWHLYEWDLEDNSQWEGWVNGNGVISGPTVTLDSIQFWGHGAATVYLDEVLHNPSGSLSVATPTFRGDFNGNGSVEQADLDLVLLNWGADGTVPPGGWVHDLPEGPIEQTELDRVLLNWGVAAGGVGAQPVPEPRLGFLALLAASGWFFCRPCVKGRRIGRCPTTSRA